ncbi:MAG: hypothetical protein Hyperionvirus22_28 [Hyperionvirus sp.]|uniref:Uncharacterized protein n=1 Tax=Hyperionvirus sp. TaxID=2487770 RepID=A0A3G5AAU2_9VIRU|nr:MAG: hypothetical protein Hyperionvirus22_28 [Hyperionvirus sp.]
MKISDRIPVDTPETDALVAEFYETTKDLFPFYSTEQIPTILGPLYITTGAFYTHQMVTPKESQIILQIQSWLTAPGINEVAHNYLSEEAAKLGHQTLITNIKSGKYNTILQSLAKPDHPP